MSGCGLLTGKTEEEARKVCLACPIPECRPSQNYKCRKCGGKLYLDEGELACLQCGARFGERKPVDSKNFTAVTIKSSQSVMPLHETALEPHRLPAYVYSGIPVVNGHWYPIRQIRFTPEQMIFLLTYLNLIRAGRYPPDPKESGYTDVKAVRRGGHSAFFTKAVELAAEIDTRLARTGIDREIVEKAYCNGFQDDDIARYYYMDIVEIHQKLRSVISYISSGPCPRWINCGDCDKYETCTHHKHRGMTYKEWKSRRRQTIKRFPINRPGKASQAPPKKTDALD